ncbi:Uma2 family endonuclease [Synechococcus sp. PCC 6312]|uniref:Uma2 family endonuclease n=1 Tax=Synechococcus sp. (strain ATCC 27167 / PCC 6312) TaxID=195253 RepID=UPI00029EE76A|nr:Uma2 family endonuclease [Synechococcus sp. PCC 6312]AFY61394.1 hypothetical protein Syn6312_2279 [Synechococcus sp. PCC 6312]
MIAQSSSTDVSAEEYLELEQNSPEKHEYIDGLVYAMAGANSNHVTICINLVTMLRDHVRGLGCQIFMSDMKVRIEKKNCYYYPDLFVTCDAQDRDNTTYKQFPKLIIEVLSDSTEAFDRGDKFDDYSSLESLEEYILVSAKRKKIDCFQKSQSNSWMFQSFTSDKFMLKSLNFLGNISRVYEETTTMEEAIDKN